MTKICTVKAVSLKKVERPVFFGVFVTFPVYNEVRSCV
jgi:hypothetical protein